MLRLIVLTLFITFLTGCTVVEPIDRAAMNPTDQLADETLSST